MTGHQNKQPLSHDQIFVQFPMKMKNIFSPFFLSIFSRARRKVLVEIRREKKLKKKQNHLDDMKRLVKDTQAINKLFVIRAPTA